MITVSTFYLAGYDLVVTGPSVSANVKALRRAVRQWCSSGGADPRVQFDRIEEEARHFTVSDTTKSEVLWP